MTLTFFGIAGSIHTEESGNTSFALQSGNILVLIDCSGNPVQSFKKSGLNPKNLDAVFLTHAHIDHIYALPSLFHNLWLLKRERALSVYAEKDTLETAKRLCAVFGIEKKESMFPLVWRNLKNNPITLIGSESGEKPQIKTDLTIKTFAVNHHIPTKGFVFIAEGKKLVYFADTAPITKYSNCSYDADAVIHECAGTDEDAEKINNSGHCTAKQTAKAAQNIRAKTIYLCHLPDSAEKKRRCVDEVKRLSSIPVLVPELFIPHMI